MYEVWRAPEVVVAFGTLLAGGAALWGAFTASRGLNRWKDQKEWEDSRQLAREIALKSRACSDSFHALRSPFMSAGEMDAAYREKFDEAVDQFDTGATEQAAMLALNVRLGHLNEPMKELYPKLIEADILWHTNLEKVHSEMRSLINKVVTAHELKNIGSTGEQTIQYRRTAYGLRDDDIGVAFEGLVSKLVETGAGRLKPNK